MKPTPGVHFVTIDFDYFNDWKREVRDTFPPISDGSLGAAPDNKLWINFPGNRRFIAKSGDHFSGDKFDAILSAFRMRFERGLDIREAFTSENHGYAAIAVDKVTERHPDSKLFVYNIDYHHDFSYCGSEIRCDNWLRLVQEKYPESDCSWCGRKDSLTTSFGEEVPVKRVNLDYLCSVIMTEPNLYVHLCRSDLYSPPAYDWAFMKLCDFFKNYCKLVYPFEPIEHFRFDSIPEAFIHD